MRGIQIAMAYWRQRGFDVLTFLPESLVTRKASDTTRLADFAPLADDLPALMRMVESGEVVLTPAQVAYLVADSADLLVVCVV